VKRKLCLQRGRYLNHLWKKTDVSTILPDIEKKGGEGYEKTKGKRRGEGHQSRDLLEKKAWLFQKRGGGEPEREGESRKAIPEKGKTYVPHPKQKKDKVFKRCKKERETPEEGRKERDSP